MGKMMFGWDEKLECIQPVGVTAEGGEPLCLAHKTSKLFVVAGVYVRDDGYVLAKTPKLDSYYPLPDADELSSFQARGLMPSPLPPYSVSPIEYAIGYSLWIILIGIAAFEVIKRKLSQARQARTAHLPVTLGPPKQETEGDRFITQKVQEQLQPGETLQHQAYAMTEPADVESMLFVALTNQRLLVFKAPRGAFKPILETKSCQAIPRADITSANEVGYVITLSLANGLSFAFGVPKSEKHFTNQEVFVRDVPRLLTGATPGLAAPQLA